MSQTKAQLLDGKSATIQFTGGSASAPAVSFTGDTNTGIYSPGADQVAISTGGTQKLAIDSSGNVSLAGPNLSIGGTAPSNAGYSNLYVNNTSGAQLFLSVNGSNSRVIYSTATDLNYYISNSSPHIWFTNAAERMRLDASGRLGVGTSAPGYKVEIAGTSGSAVLGLLETGVRSWGIRAGGALTNTFDIADFTAGVTRLTIDSSGRVGIGTTSPIAPIDTRLNAASGTVGFFSLSGQTNNPALSINIDEAASTVTLRAGASAGVGQNLTFNTGFPGSERARIDSSGRLLVGTSSYSFAATAVLQGNSSASNEDAALRMNRGSTPGAYADLGLITFGDNAGNIGAAIRAANDTASSWGSGDYPGRLTFFVTADGSGSPSEAMLIRNTGQIQTISISSPFYTATTQAAGTTYSLYSGSYGASGIGGGTESFRVWSNGNVQNTNNSYTAISDIKLKENIVDASSQWDDIKALQVRNYNLKEGQTHRQIGLIAQEVEPISPGLVYESPDRDADGNDLGTVTKSVNYSVLYMKAVKALQEAMERIETLEAKVAALESA